MNESNRKIGRGLKELLNENQIDTVLEGEVVVEILLREISPNPFQPRRIFSQDKIDDLAASIKEHGVFQPIIVKRVHDGYIIVSGERRYRACKQLGLSKIPAIVRQYDKQKVAEIALMENLQREDLTPIEEAEAYLNVMKHLDLTQKELADRIGLSRSHVTNILGLLNLPDKVQTLILTQEISMGHARALSKLESKERIEHLANLILKNGLSVRQIEEMAKTEKKTKEIKKPKPKVFYGDLAKKVSSQYSVSCKIQNNKIIIQYDDDDIAKKILEVLSK